MIDNEISIRITKNLNDFEIYSEDLDLIANGDTFEEAVANFVCSAENDYKFFTSDNVIIESNSVDPEIIKETLIWLFER